MDTKAISNDVKAEVSRQLEKLDQLRDEVKLHLHLASLDAKQEWDKLDPKIAELQGTAQHLSDASKSAVQELVTKVEAFVTKLRTHKSS
jgi:methyl coenzyme M reductase subunit C-like uncharacterized protein (methanogenesis marker protein 7)